MNEKKEFPNKDDIKKYFTNSLNSYKKVILPSFFVEIISCNTLNIRPFQYTNDNYNISYSLFRIIACVILADILFYLLYRVIHIPYFYKKMHKVHHEYKDNSFSLVNHHMHLDELCLFMFLIVISGVLLNVYVYELYFISFLFNFCQGYAHSNYNFKFLNCIFDSNHHNNHHIYFNYNYVALTKIPDKIFGTLKM